MDLLLPLLGLGLLHGLQPDHAAVAYGAAARTRGSVLRAALAVAAGHGAALLLFAAVFGLLPGRWLTNAAWAADWTAGAVLVAIGLAHALHALRPHRDVAPHKGHPLLAAGLGLVIGLAGFRGSEILFAGLGRSPLLLVGAYALGIAAGAVVWGMALDLARRLARGASAGRWLDLAAAGGTAALGLRMLALAG